MECAKCRYVRKAVEDAPDWQCPSCGAAYNKTGGVAQPKRGATPSRSGRTFKNIRIFILMLILFFVAADAWLTRMRSSDWDRALWVVVYPIAAEPHVDVKEYIPSLSAEGFSGIERFMADQGALYGLSLSEPIEIDIAPPIADMPPLPPHDGGVFEVIVWSLRLRYWAMVSDSYDGPKPHIRVFVLYHRAEEGRRLAHSTGLQKGMISLVHAFAERALEQKNNVVIAHEILHTLGATDKYDLNTGLPYYPLGYADAGQQPLFPQRRAELMAARIPVSKIEARMPSSLNEVVIGKATALEIGWLDIDDVP